MNTDIICTNCNARVPAVDPKIVLLHVRVGDTNRIYAYCSQRCFDAGIANVKTKNDRLRNEISEGRSILEIPHTIKNIKLVSGLGETPKRYSLELVPDYSIEISMVG